MYRREGLYNSPLYLLMSIIGRIAGAAAELIGGVATAVDNLLTLPGSNVRESEQDRITKRCAAVLITRLETEIKELYNGGRSLEEVKRLSALIDKCGRVKCALTRFKNLCKEQNDVIRELSKTTLTDEERKNLLESYSMVLKEKERTAEECVEREK